MSQTKQPKCDCRQPVPVSPCPPQIHCLQCGGIIHYDRKTALREAIARVDESQSRSLRTAGYAFFLEELGFDFGEIDEYLEQQALAEAQGVQE